jgi:hypothetical protein
MGILGIGKSRFKKVGTKARGAMLGAGKVTTTGGKIATVAGGAGVVATPFVTAINPAAGAALASGSAYAVAGGGLAKISGRGMKKTSKGKARKFDASRALMRD